VVTSDKLTKSIHLLSLTLVIATIFLGYGAITASAQQLGSDQPCSASYPCAKICGDHICAAGEIPNESPHANQTMTQSANATTPVPLPFKLSTKGMINNSSGIAPGTVIWTALNGNNAVFIFHGVNGLEVIRLTTTPDPICNNAQAQICLDTTVTQTKDPDNIAAIGTQAKINIRQIENLETVGFLSGPFQNIMLQIDLSKVWTYTGASTIPSASIANPASTYCINHGGTLQIKTSPAGQYGMCTFSNGSQCEEWQFFRGQCSATQSSMNTTSMQTNSTSMIHTMNSTSTNSTSMHSTMVNTNSTNGTSMKVTNSTYK
jgi:putative hemolysin